MSGTPINFSMLTPLQRQELDRIIQSVTQTTQNLGATNSQKAVNDAIQKYFKDLNAKKISEAKNSVNHQQNLTAQNSRSVNFRKNKPSGL